MPLALKNARQNAKPRPVSLTKAVQATLAAKAEQLKQLQLERHQLLNREQILWQGIDQQECIVYHLGLLLSEELSMAKAVEDNPDSSHAQTAATLAAMLNDVRALQMKSGVGSGPSSGRGTRRLYTSQLLCAAITPQNVAYIKAADVEKDLVPRFRAMTMRLSYLLSTSVDDSLLTDSLSEKVDEYSQLVQLLHTAADDKLLALGLLNFETMQQEFPPPGHWEFVVERLELRPEQEEELAIGFNWYAARRTELIKQLDESVRKLRMLMGPLYPQSPAGEPSAEQAASEQAEAEQAPAEQAPAAGSADTADASTATAAARAAAVTAGQSSGASTAAPQPKQQQPALDASSDPLAQLDSGRGGSTTSSSAPAADAGASVQQGAALGVLDPETAEDLHWALADVDRLNRAIREVDRFCVYLGINALEKRQLALSAIFCYPYLVQPPACCEVVARIVAKRRAALAAVSPDHVAIPVVKSEQLCEALPTTKPSATLHAPAATAEGAGTPAAAD